MARARGDVPCAPPTTWRGVPRAARTATRQGAAACSSFEVVGTVVGKCLEARRGLIWARSAAAEGCSVAHAASTGRAFGDCGHAVRSFSLQAIVARHEREEAKSTRGRSDWRGRAFASLRLLPRDAAPPRARGSLPTAHSDRANDCPWCSSWPPARPPLRRPCVVYDFPPAAQARRGGAQQRKAPGGADRGRSRCRRRVRRARRGARRSGIAVTAAAHALRNVRRRQASSPRWSALTEFNCGAPKF